jgi:hypothetical protein
LVDGTVENKINEFISKDKSFEEYAEVIKVK